jgi:aspartyl-tRNA(Asn)/glutamyl-tRNA(Gln) amidotransferase subunit B
LLDIIRKAIADNPKAVEDYKKGKVAAAQRIKGSVMKETKGTVKPDVVDAKLAEELARL